MVYKWLQIVDAFAKCTRGLSDFAAETAGHSNDPISDAKVKISSSAAGPDVRDGFLNNLGGRLLSGNTSEMKYA